MKERKRERTHIFRVIPGQARMERERNKGEKEK